jgi:hypothetical protein
MTLIKPNDEWRVDAQPTMSTKHDIIKSSDPHDCARRQELNCAICDGGLAVCRRCGEYEAGLGKPCLPRDLSGIHDSDNCILGPNDLPCDMCVAAGEYERSQRQDRQPPLPLWADVATIRAALMDTIDAGAPSGWWELYDDGGNPEVTEDMVNKERCEFADAVLARITQLQQPPHNYPRRPASDVTEAA